jgi:hypothetical protein
MRVFVVEGDEGFSRLGNENKHEVAYRDGERGEKAQPKNPGQVGRRRDAIRGCG